MWITPISSGAYKASVKGTGEGYVGCALNEGAAIGEESDGVGGALETEEKVVEADFAMDCKAIAHGGEVYRAVVFVNLDGIATAEGDVWAAFAGEMGEDALAADCAGGIWFGGADFAPGAGPEIEGEDGSAREVVLIREELECFGDLNGGGEVDGGAEDAGGIAGFDRAHGLLGEDAREAGCGSQGPRSGEIVGRFGEDGHGGRVGAYSCGVDPGFGLLDGIVVDEVSGLEVVGGIEDEVGGG